MSYNTLIVSIADGTCFVQINRLNEKNKLSIECMNELTEAFKEAAEDMKCFSIILSGQPDCFCFGGELGDFRKKSILEIKMFGNAFIILHIAMSNCPKPIIAAVEGDALGGGFSLVEACDLAVGSETANFAIPEILEGLAPAMGLSGIFANLGKKEIMSLGLLGEKFSANKALELGMINWVEPKANVLDKAKEIAEFFVKANPTAIKMFKELYVDMGMRNYENRLKMGQAMMIGMLKSKDGMEVLDSREQFRAPIWCGE